MLLTQHGNNAKTLSPSPFFGLEIQRELTEQGSFAKILNPNDCLKLGCQARSERLPTSLLRHYTSTSHVRTYQDCENSSLTKHRCQSNPTFSWQVCSDGLLKDLLGTYSLSFEDPIRA